MNLGTSDSTADTGAATADTGTNANANAAGVATGDTGTADNAAAAPAKKTNKTQLAETIFREMCGQGKTRAEILEAFRDPNKVGLTQDGASTYYANLKAKLNMSGAKSVRAPRPEGTKPAAGGAKTGSSTKVTGTKKTAPAAGAAPQFAVVTVKDGKVESVQPMFAQTTAIRTANEKPDNIAVAGVPNIGDAITLFTALQTAGE